MSCGNASLIIESQNEFALQLYDKLAFGAGNKEISLFIAIFKNSISYLKMATFLYRHSACFLCFRCASEALD
jgi:hypothetical protein